MGIRVWPMAVALAVFAAAWLRMLIVTGADDPLADWSSIGGALAGLTISLLGALPVAGAVWAAAGGDVGQVVVGSGPRVWFRRTAAGALVSVHALPLTAVLAGVGARPGRGPRAPYVASVGYWGALGVAGAAALLSEGLVFGLGAGAFLVAVAHLAARPPAAYWSAATSATEARLRARMVPVVRAAQRNDRAEVRRLTADLPGVPAHWTDTYLATLRAAALTSPTDAAQLLRATLTEPPDAMAPLVRAELTGALFAALLRGEVPAEHRAAVEAEIRARVADRATLRRPAVFAYTLAAIGAYLEGRWAVAAARGVAAAKAIPPGLAGDAWALASLACAAAGDPAHATGHLESALRDDPDASLVPVARAALTPGALA